VYGAADPGTRRAVHRALAAVVPASEADRLAWHLSAGAVPPDEATAATLDQVAEQASSRGAHAIAASAHERAADLSVSPAQVARRLAAAGAAAWLAGRTERAGDLLDRALASHPDPALRARIQQVRGGMETRCGSLDTALATLLEAAGAVEAGHPDLAVGLYADAIHVAFYLGDAPAALRSGAAIEGLLGVCTEPGTRSLGSMASGMALVLGGSGEEGIERVRGAAYPLVDVAATDTLRLPLRLQGALWLRDSGPHRAPVRDAIDRLREQAALGSLPYLLMHIARDAATTDRWDDAEAAYAESIRLAGETGQSTDLAVSLAGLACLNARRGRAEECRENVAAAEDLCRRNHIRLGSWWLELAQGDLAAGLGDLAEGVRHYEALEALLAETAMADPDQSCGPELVEAYLQLGRTEEARRLAIAFAAKAEAKGQPWSLARAERAHGLCASGPEAEAHFRAALELHALTPDRYETARTELAFGARLRRDRQRVAARPLLRSALRSFEELGATPWADRAAQELEATGETAHRRLTQVRDTLTPQERQIAQLLAQGRTTREAAAALFISPKTVEYHLRHVYLKLDIRSRAALTEMFREQPAPPG
jgi:DNA-binding CsgD family transcriptional regulator